MVHSGKDPRKRLKKQTCERARKERMGEWSGVKAVSGGVKSLRFSVDLAGHSSCPS